MSLIILNIYKQELLKYLKWYVRDKRLMDVKLEIMLCMHNFKGPSLQRYGIARFTINALYDLDIIVYNFGNSTMKSLVNYHELSVKTVLIIEN